MAIGRVGKSYEAYVSNNEESRPYQQGNFHHDLWRAADHGLQFLPHIGRLSLRRAESSAGTHESGETQANMLARPRAWKGLR